MFDQNSDQNLMSFILHWFCICLLLSNIYDTAGQSEICTRGFSSTILFGRNDDIVAIPAGTVVLAPNLTFTCDGYITHVSIGYEVTDTNSSGDGKITNKTSVYLQWWKIDEGSELMDEVLLPVGTPRRREIYYLLSDYELPRKIRVKKNFIIGFRTPNTSQVKVLVNASAPYLLDFSNGQTMSGVPQLMVTFRKCLDHFTTKIPDVFQPTYPLEGVASIEVLFLDAQFICNGTITQLKGWYQVLNNYNNIETPFLFQVWHPVNQSYYRLMSEVGIPPASNKTAVTVDNLSIPFYSGSVVGVFSQNIGIGSHYINIDNGDEVIFGHYFINKRICTANTNVSFHKSLFIPNIQISYDVIEEDVNITLINSCNFPEQPTSNDNNSTAMMALVLVMVAGFVIIVGMLILIVHCCIKKERLLRRSRRLTHPNYETNPFYFDPDLIFDNRHYYRLESVSKVNDSYEPAGKSFITHQVPYRSPRSSLDQILSQVSHVVISKDSIELGAEIGSGEFAAVMHGVWNNNGTAKQVAVKILHQDEQSVRDKVKLFKEAAIIGQFSHKNIVKLYGIVTIGSPMIILEYLSNGNLLEFLFSNRPKQGDYVEQRVPQMLLGFARDIADGMNYLSLKCFIHRDLAARNILLTEDNVCKIADFGLARDLEAENHYVTCGGAIPLKWTAPEALLYRIYTTASDVWSYGILLYEMWSLGHKPYEDYDNSDVVNLLDTGYRLPPPPGCPRLMYTVMMQCWNPEHKLRPSFATILRSVSQPFYVLFHWFAEDKDGKEPECDVIGAPLQTGRNLFLDLQNMYK